MMEFLLAMGLCAAVGAVIWAAVAMERRLLAPPDAMQAGRQGLEP
jgi:hypothetical protein